MSKSLFTEFKLPPGQYVGEGRVEYLFDTCPGCFKEKHFYFNVFKKQGECKVCGLTLFGLDAFEDMDGAFHRPAIITARKRTVTPQTINAWFHEPARVWLHERGVSAQQCLTIPITYEPGPNRIVCPVDPVSPEFGSTSLVRWFAYEDSKWFAREGSKKIRYIFNAKALPRPKILVMEGIFDVLASDMEDYAIALLGTVIKGDPGESVMSLLDYHQVKEVFVWFDWDDAGRKGTKHVIDMCCKWGISCQDLTSVLQREPKSLCPRLSRGGEEVLNEIKRGLE